MKIKPKVKSQRRRIVVIGWTKSRGLPRYVQRPQLICDVAGKSMGFILFCRTRCASTTTAIKWSCSTYSSQPWLVAPVGRRVSAVCSVSSLSCHHTTLRVTWYRYHTRKLCYHKDDRAMRFCCAILIQYRYDPAIKVRSSDENKGRGRCRAESWNYGLRPGVPLVSPKFLHFPWE